MRNDGDFWNFLLLISPTMFCAKNLADDGEGKSVGEMTRV